MKCSERRASQKYWLTYGPTHRAQEHSVTGPSSEIEHLMHGNKNMFVLQACFIRVSVVTRRLDLETAARCTD